MRPDTIWHCVTSGTSSRLFANGRTPSLNCVTPPLPPRSASRWVASAWSPSIAVAGVASVPPWSRAGSRSRNSDPWWRAVPWRVGSPCTPSIRASGLGALLKPALSRPLSPFFAPHEGQACAGRLGLPADRSPSELRPVQLEMAAGRIAVHPWPDTEAVAVQEARAFLACLPAQEGVPLFLFDTGHSSVVLSEGLGDTPVAVPVRLRCDCSFYGDPPPSSGKADPSGMAQDGLQGACDLAGTDPGTRGAWSAARDGASSGLGGPPWRQATGFARARSAPGPPDQRDPWSPSHRPRELDPGRSQSTVRMNAQPQSLWLFYYGSDRLNLGVVSRAYVHRLDAEHTIRYLNQTPDWTAPRLRHPERADRWTCVITAACAQLCIARCCAAGRLLPWERRLEPERTTPASTGWRGLLGSSCP